MFSEFNRQFSVLILILLLSNPILISCKILELFYEATWVQANPNGLFNKTVIGFNNSWPLPIIRANKGDTINLYLTNKLKTKNTSLHFHGMFQNGSNLMDGADMITQCTIPPDQTFLYNFTLSDNQVGTYWYHSHTGSQYLDGLRGLFIINDNNVNDVTNTNAVSYDINNYNNSLAPFDYDEEITISLSDWYHKQYFQLNEEFLNRYNPTGAEPIPDSLIINDTINLNWNILPDKTYLLRLINVGVFVSQYFSIEDHELTVVEIDGVYVTPVKTNLLYLTVAQRYSVLLKSKSIDEINSKYKNYKIMQIIDKDMLDFIPDKLQLNYTNHLVYDNKIPVDNNQYYINDLSTHLNDFYLKPLDDIQIFDDYDYQIILDFEMDNLGDGINYAFFNNITYVQPKVPSLLTALTAPSHLVNNPSIYGSNTNTFILKYNEVIEIVLNNKDSNRHPFHLHGHNFQVIQRSPAFDDDDNPVSYNESDHQPFPEFPLIRDTVYVEKNGYLVLRFKANNPGAWIFHCHLDWHLEQGLAIILMEAPEVLQSTPSQQITENYKQMCIHAGIPVKGNAAGNFENFLDLSNENKQPNPLPDGFTLKGYIAIILSSLLCLWGIFSIVSFGLNDNDQNNHDVYENLKKVLTDHNLIDEENFNHSGRISYGKLNNQESQESQSLININRN
ncbi:uncharacterized protein ASCRUDRAFT_76977 [Ascoidea rubescens DSM 1968]|uniref:Multicopper oxidase n=1 Tax=Ascoidea rubescens DSM 1968 TaxID=1344418 RepID=A0A1D2VDA1_9ASCO|nr:hypothetical protein ASCRUDRAFT_76977 [Ascoidea rubescens DSM 1968]ODV59615.1 hypothetical protein ASCRUDRAFT_76977 [Ascoidea rubescens DSM 1968]